MTTFAAAVDHDLRRTALALTDQGLSARQIGKRLGRSSRTVVRWRTTRKDTTMPTLSPRPAARMDAAACLDQAETFFPETETPTTVAAAKAICARCLVRVPCLDDALRLEKGDDKNRAGIRGGLDPKERAALATSRRKAAAKKKAAAAAEQARV